MQNLDLARGILYRRRGDPEIEDGNKKQKLRSNSFDPADVRSQPQRDIYNLSLTEFENSKADENGPVADCEWVNFYTIIKFFKISVGENVVASSEFDDMDLICSNLHVQINIGNSDFLEKEPFTLAVPVNSVHSVKIHQLEINEDKSFNKFFFEINPEEFENISNQLNLTQSSKSNNGRNFIKISTHKVLSENFKTKILKIFGNKLKFVTLYQPSRSYDSNKIENSQLSCLTQNASELVPILQQFWNKIQEQNSTEITNKEKAESQNVPHEIIEISNSDSDENFKNLENSNLYLNRNPNVGKNSQIISKRDQSLNLDHLQILKTQVKDSETDSKVQDIITKNCYTFRMGKYVEASFESNNEIISVSISDTNFGIEIDAPEYFDIVSKLNGRKVSLNIPMRESSIRRIQIFRSSIHFELNFEECVKIMNQLGITERQCWSWEALNLDADIFSKFFKILIKIKSQDKFTQDEGERLKKILGLLLLPSKFVSNNFPVPEPRSICSKFPQNRRKSCSFQFQPPDEMPKIPNQKWISINCSNFKFRKFKCRRSTSILLDILSDKFVFHIIKGPNQIVKKNIELAISFASLESFEIFEQNNRLEFLFNQAEILKITQILNLKVENFSQAYNYNVIRIWTVQPLSPTFVERLKTFIESKMTSNSEENSTRIQKICSTSSYNEKEPLFKKIPIVSIRPFNIPWKNIPLTSFKPPSPSTKKLQIFSTTNCKEPSVFQNEELDIVKNCYMVKIGAKIVSENLDSSLAAAAEGKITIKISQNCVEIDVVVSDKEKSETDSNADFNIILPCEEISNMKIDKFSGNNIFNFELYPEKHLEIRNQFNMTTEEFSQDKEGTKYIKVFTREQLDENYFGIMGVIFNNKLVKLDQNKRNLSQLSSTSTDASKSSINELVNENFKRSQENSENPVENLHENESKMPEIENKDNFVQSYRSEPELAGVKAEKRNENDTSQPKPKLCQNNQKISSAIFDNFSDFSNSPDNFGSVKSNAISGLSDFSNSPENFGPINSNPISGLSDFSNSPDSFGSIRSNAISSLSDFSNSPDNFDSVSELSSITCSSDQSTKDQSENCQKNTNFAKYLREHALKNASKLSENSNTQDQPQPGPSHNSQKLSSNITINDNSNFSNDIDPVNVQRSSIPNFFSDLSDFSKSDKFESISQSFHPSSTSTGRSRNIFQENSTSKLPYREKTQKLSIWTNKGFLVKIGKYWATAINDKSNANDKIHLIITSENVTIDFHTFDSNLTGKPENIKFSVDSVQSVKIYESNNNNMMFFELNTSTSDRIREEFNLHISNYSTCYTEENLEARYIKIFIRSTLKQDFLRTVSGIFGLKLKFINHQESELLNGFKKLEKTPSLFICNPKVYIYPCFKMYFGGHMIEGGGCKELHLYPGNGKGKICLAFERKSKVCEMKTRKSFDIPNDKNINYFYAIENRVRMIFFIELKQGFKFIQDIFNFVHENNDIDVVKKYPGFDPFSTNLEKKYIILLFDSRGQILDIEKLQIDIFETFQLIQYKCRYMTGQEIAINLFKFIDTI